MYCLPHQTYLSISFRDQVSHRLFCHTGPEIGQHHITSYAMTLISARLPRKPGSVTRLCVSRLCGSFEAESRMTDVQEENRSSNDGALESNKVFLSSSQLACPAVTQLGHTKDASCKDAEGRQRQGDEEGFEAWRWVETWLVVIRGDSLYKDYTVPIRPPGKVNSQ